MADRGIPISSENVKKMAPEKAPGARRAKIEEGSARRSAPRRRSGNIYEAIMP
jgi:hypothetical protein